MSSVIAETPSWHADIELAADIAPSGVAACPAGAVLVTGATGYLGRHLLRELLVRRESLVYCLARRNAEGSAVERVTRALQAVGEPAPSAVGRLRILDADLSAPGLGLAARSYAALASDVSTIVHCAADVSWSRCYAQMRSANVVPVSNLLRLACEGAAKHFAMVSSIAVCHSSDRELHTNERSDPMEYIGRIPLGYAQSKAVAERLVRLAAGRGLSATIFRPALIAGHTRGGEANAEDFVSWLVSGCVRMGWAPDVDWRLDAVPVDYVAAAIGANLDPRQGLETLHVTHPEPREWRELVLLVNLCGYEVRLEPLARWIERLSGFPDRTLPLKRFMKFFSRRAPGGNGLTVSQVYEAGGQPRISSARSADHLTRQGFRFPKMDAAYFGQYLSSLARSHVLPPPSLVHARRTRHAQLDPAVLRALHPLQDGAAAKPALDLRPARVDVRGSITAELSSWRHGGHIGLYGVSSDGGGSAEANLILKIIGLDKESIATVSAVASACSAELGRCVERYGATLDFWGAGEREVDVYRSGISDVGRHRPRCYAYGQEPDYGRPMLLLERLTDVKLLNTVDQPNLWTDTYIEAAIRDLATIHAVHYRRELQLRELPPSIRTLNAAQIIDAQELWVSLCKYGRPFFIQCGGSEFAARIERLVSALDDWMSAYGGHPSSLVHNDCNPRNMAFRQTPQGPSMCLYDWELCTVAPPQRDLAELLCFTIGADGADARAHRYVELHRSELARNSGRPIDPDCWRSGFRFALADVMVRRLLMYTMLHSYVKQTFLPRVMRSWRALDLAMQEGGA